MKKFLSLLLLLGFIFLTTAAYGQIAFTAKIDGAQEVPSVTTTATGTGTFVLNAGGTQLTYHITINGLTPTLAHFHNGPVGTAAGVVKNLSFTNGVASGTWSSTDASQPLTDSLLTELLRGRLYVNVHTAANGGGEIRGQVLMTTGAGFTAKLDGTQEVPAVTTTALGTASVRLNTDGTVAYDVSVTGLTPTVSHFHNAAAGISAGVVKNISLVNNTAAGTWASGDASQPLTDLLLRELIKGRLYVNVHTAANGGGEIRGQVLFNTGTTFTAKIDGAQEVPSVTTTASGTGTFVLNASGTQLTYHITINGLTPTLAHFHNGPVGTAAGVVKNLSFTNGVASGTWSSTDVSQPLTDVLLTELLKGRLYVNVHTTANPGGEIRGQVLMTTGAGFTARMDGNQETPNPLTTNAVGTASVRFNTDGTVAYDVTVTGLTPTAAHFHNAATGVTGGVVKTISLSNNTAAGTWASGDASQPLTDALLLELIKGRLYANAHTTVNAGGEIRGQVLGVTGIATSVERIENTLVPTSFTLEQNYPNPFNPSTVINFQIAKASQVSLKVYNLMGQVVATLLDGVKEAGAYKVTFDAKSLASGIYFYQLAADGALLQTKKMLLLK
ncbi:MAG: CHRD domain-containing protein [Ignavibacteriales bacterium]|nr:CHRD domain-containing protein [Ignavibacteriales bacterium]